MAKKPRMSFEVDTGDKDALDAVAGYVAEAIPALGNRGAQTIVQRTALRIGLELLSRDPEGMMRVGMNRDAIVKRIENARTVRRAMDNLDALLDPYIAEAREKLKTDPEALRDLTKLEAASEKAKRARKFGKGRDG